MTILTRLLDHYAWADARALGAIATLPDGAEQRAQCVRLYAHLAAAAHIWLSRLRGRTPDHPVWPDLSLDAASALAAESLAGLRAFAAGDEHALAVEVEYRNSAGTSFRNAVGDVLSQVLLHGTYHRGQLALLARQGGGTPAATDFIVFARTPAV
jgi:uncharacterized damage-inducible protein DinB